jgi:cytochrome c oxidase cbb3-type subunit 4
MSYEAMTGFAQTWGLAFLVVLFVGAVLYALWPRNSEKFRRGRTEPWPPRAKRTGSPASR